MNVPLSPSKDASMLTLPLAKFPVNANVDVPPLYRNGVVVPDPEILYVAISLFILSQSLVYIVYIIDFLLNAKSYITLVGVVDDDLADGAV